MELTLYFGRLLELSKCRRRARGIERRPFYTGFGLVCGSSHSFLDRRAESNGRQKSSRLVAHVSSMPTKELATLFPREY